MIVFRTICESFLHLDKILEGNSPEITQIVKQISQCEPVASFLNFQPEFEEFTQHEKQMSKNLSYDFKRASFESKTDLDIANLQNNLAQESNYKFENRKSQFFDYSDGIETPLGNHSLSIDLNRPQLENLFLKEHSSPLESLENEDNQEVKLFQSYKDFVEFDEKLKHITPIANYEFNFLEELENNDQNFMWEVITDTKQVKVLKSTTKNSPIIIIKAIASFPEIPPEILAKHIWDISLREKWDSTFEDFKIIEEDIDGCQIIYCTIKAPFPVSNREFLQWRKILKTNDQSIQILQRSASHPKIKLDQEYVRAETIISGYIIRSTNDTNTSSQIFLVSQTDIKGYIPKWLVSSVAARAPAQWVSKLKEACIEYITQNQFILLPEHISPSVAQTVA